MDDGAGGADPTVRVSDADRAGIADHLARAQAEGRLDLSEFDRRVRAAYAAVSRADLAPLTADLPADVAVPPASSGRSVGEVTPGAGVDAEPSARRGLAAAAGVWATVSALNLAVWAVVALAASGPVHPWWIWVAGPWGVMLAARALAGAPAGLPCVARPRR